MIRVVTEPKTFLQVPERTPAGVLKALHAGTSATLEEDKVMIEAQARMMAGESLDARTLHTHFDGTPARVRRIIAELVSAECAPAAVA